MRKRGNSWHNIGKENIMERKKRHLSALVKLGTYSMPL
jgi:hypothetical protein